MTTPDRRPGAGEGGADHLPVLVRLGLGLVAFGAVLGGLSWLAWAVSDDEPPLPGDASNDERVMHDRREVAGEMRYLVCFVPVGVLLLVVAGMQALMDAVA